MKKFILVFALLASSLSFAYASCFSDGDLEHLIERCAEHIIDNRIYLKPGCVFVSAKDIFIKVEDEIAVVEAVYCDEIGVYIYDYQLSSLVYCHTCHRRYDPEKQSVVCPHLPRPKK